MIDNHRKIALVVVGYNRINGIKRLLKSLSVAHYPVDDVPLVISIDCSGNQKLYDYVNEYQWMHGPKTVNIQSDRLGLKEHIFKCARLSQNYRGIIILEDDLYVSPDFYNFALAALDKYENNDSVAGIGLYSEEINGYEYLPFRPINNGSDCYAFQSVCSWGEIWTYQMWNAFETWLNKWDGDFSKIDMIDRIKNWTRAWSKYFYAYIISTNRYFIYPYVSLSTNFNDAGGEHGGGGNPIVQVAMQRGCRNYNFLEFDDLEKYDVYQQNVCLYDCLGLTSKELTIDLYGQRYKEKRHKRYLLTTYVTPYKLVMEYGLQLRPIEANIIDKIEGTGIFLYDTSMCDSKRSTLPYGAIAYHLQGFNFRCLLKYIVVNVFKRIKAKII